MDIKIVWDPLHSRGDWAVTQGDLLVDDGGIESAVLVSLFTDRRASDDYEPPAGEPYDRHGWWGDTYEPSLIGSRLWQLNRAKKSDGRALLNQANDYCREALQWLVDDGVAASITVNCAWLKPDVLGISILISPPSSPPKVFNFSWAWGVSTATVLGDASGFFVADPSGVLVAGVG